MKSLTALIKREYLEHRGAFLYAPAAILVLLIIVMLSGVTFGRFRTIGALGIASGAKGFEVGFLVIGMLWSFYLLIALFFYFADAFSADSRNNAMLFWKSMPQSDFKILASKVMASLTIFPVLIFAAWLLSGVVVLVTAGMILLSAPDLMTSPPLAFASAAGNVIAFGVGYVVLLLLWYAPFFTWVGLLSTLFRRWSIPLAFLVPALVGLGENLLFRAMPGGPEHGYVLGYLRQRFSPPVDRDDLAINIFNDTAFNAGQVFARVFAQIDWVQLGGGLIVAALLVYLASEYRRRFVAT